MPRNKEKTVKKRTTQTKSEKRLEEQTAESRVTNKPSWVPTVLIPWLIVVIIVLVICWWLQRNCEKELWVANQADYLLEGTDGWVKGRQWLLYKTSTREAITTSDNEGLLEVKNQFRATSMTLTHPDWSTKFLWNNRPDPECEGINKSEEFLADCAQRHLETISLDKDLDSWLESWAESVMLAQWTGLAEVTLVDSNTDETENGKELTSRMNEWADNLARGNWSITGLDFYMDLDRPERNDDRKEVILVWTLKNSQTNEEKLVTKGLNPYLDEQGVYRWDFTTEAFPQTIN